MKRKIIAIVMIVTLIATFIVTLLFENNVVEALSKYGSR